MTNYEEQFVNLEREYQQNLEAQKRFYESEIELLKSKFEYEKEKLRIDYENMLSVEKQAAEAEYNVKSSDNTEKLKQYYEAELESTRNWYEQEIIRRIKETEDWHVNNLEKQILELKKGYEEMLKAQQDKFKVHEEALSLHIIEQRKYYEEQLKPLRKLSNLKSKIRRKLEKLKKQGKNTVSEPAPAKPSLTNSMTSQTAPLKPSKTADYTANEVNSTSKSAPFDNSSLPLNVETAQDVQTELISHPKEINPAYTNTVSTKSKQSSQTSQQMAAEGISSNAASKNAKPKVSVILPVYNVGKYLRRSLDSLINQTLKDIEIICIDDGSTDESYDILEEYLKKDSRINVVHKENKGTGAARNDGLRLAQGECIGFVDPDDWVKPEMFERLYGLIKEKNLDIAMCMPDGYDEKNAVNAPFPYFVDENFENIIDDRVFNWRDLSPFSYPMCVWNKLYTKELFDKNNIEFAEGLDFEDHKVIFGTLLTAERMYFIREKLYVYRFNREGSVLTDNNRRLIDHIKIFDIVENLMKETNTFNILRNDFLQYKIHNILYYYSMIKDEFKDEYYNNMVQSIKDTNLTLDEYNMLCEKYPELGELKI